MDNQRSIELDNEPLTPAETGEDEDRSLIGALGPGLVTGAADDDPSGIGTYATAGAAHGYSLLWMAPFCYPLMAAVQVTCARVGLVSGMGLAGVLRRYYSRRLLYPALILLLVANTLNAGADIGAIAEALNLILPIPTGWLYVPIAMVILLVQVFGSYRLIARVFKWTTLALFAYIGAGLLAGPDWVAVLRNTLVPSIEFNKKFLITIVAILGTTISPYLFFWQTSQEVEEEIHHGRRLLSQRRGATKRELHNAALDTHAGMLAAIIVMYFIMLATAATLHASGQTEVKTAAQAAQALEPLAGSAAKYLMAIGLIGTGFLAVPILTGSTAYAVSEGLGLRHLGFDERPGKAKGFYAIIVASTVVGLAIDFSGINAMTALYLAAVVNGLLAPPLLILIMLIANNREVMGDSTNRRWNNLFGWTAAAVMSAAAIVLIAAWLFG